MEKDLFDPIRAYFEGFGYVCDGEVGDIDLYMEKDGETVAVELKATLDFKSVKQAALRQKIVDTVFIGIFRPSNMGSSAFKDSLYLLKRLGIGLIVVSPKSGMMEIVSEPVVSDISQFKTRNKGKKGVLASEFQRRRIKNNTGGVTHTKLMTGYREDALLVLNALNALSGKAPAKEVKALSNVEKAREIMYSNYYGWFERCESGIYSIRKAGYDALLEYAKVIEMLVKKT